MQTELIQLQTNDNVSLTTYLWGVDPERIAVCGFSAGGYLAAALGTMAKIRPKHISQDGVHRLSLAKAHTSNGKGELTNADAAQWFDLCLAWLEKVFGEFPVD